MNSPDITPLLQPLQVGPLRLRNRFVVPGMWSPRLARSTIPVRPRIPSSPGSTPAPGTPGARASTRCTRRAAGCSSSYGTPGRSGRRSRGAASADELRQLVAILRAAGADLFHVSTRRFWTPEWPGSDLGLAGWVKSFTDAPVIAVGSVGLDIDVMATLTGSEARPTGASRIEDLLRRFRRGDFDLVSVGRSLIGDPDWVAKISEGRGAQIRPFRRADIGFLSGAEAG